MSELRTMQWQQRNCKIPPVWGGLEVSVIIHASIFFSHLSKRTITVQSNVDVKYVLSASV